MILIILLISHEIITAVVERMNGLQNSLNNLKKLYLKPFYLILILNKFALKFSCRYPHCSEKKQICSIQYGKFEIFSGNASHDRTCLCDWANGWKPVHSISQECTDPAGFHSHMMCYCRQSRCPAGQKLGKG